MAGIVIRNSSGGNTTLYGATNAPSKYLAVYDGTRAYYIPAVTSGGSVTIGSTKYSYISSRPSFAVYDGSQTLYLANAETTIVTSYDIPAGTYYPSTFENLIKNFISTNGSRKVVNAFSVTVNGQTIDVPANNSVYYRVNGSSWQGGARSVWFESPEEEVENAPPLWACYNFTGVKAYVVYIKDINTDYTNTFEKYTNYPITVTTGIKFA